MPCCFFCPGTALLRSAPAAEDPLIPLGRAAGEAGSWIYGVAGKLVFSAAVSAVILAGFLLLTDGERGTERAGKTLIRCAAAVLAVYLVPLLLQILAGAFEQTGGISLWGMLAR